MEYIPIPRKEKRMIFKEDMDRTKERFRAFWAGEIIDRCCFAVTAPRDTPIDTGIAYKQPESLAEQHLDIAYRYQDAMRYFSHTYFGGDAYPLFWNNLGPGVGASFMGGGYHLAENTIWFDVAPVIKDWDHMQEIAFDEDSEMWRRLNAMSERLCREAKGQYEVGLTDIGGNLDIAVSLRGNDTLLYDLYDHPEEVKALVTRIDDIWMQIYEKHLAQINRYMDGVSAWMGIWCEKRWYPLQCDFSAMISADMFDEFVAPSLRREADFLDCAIYHLDGPGEIKHLDTLLGIDGITGIQCVPGSALFKDTGEFHPTFCNDTWMPVMKKIQASGKNLVLHEVHPSELTDLMDNLSAKGLYIATAGKSEEEARYLLKKAEKWR